MEDDNNVLDDDFDFDSDEPVEESASAEEALLEPEDDFDFESDDPVEEDNPDDEKPAEPKQPRLSPKARRGLLGGAAALVAVAVLAALVWFAVAYVMLPHERRVINYVENLRYELAIDVDSAFELLGNVIIIDIDELDGRTSYVFIPYRASGGHGQLQRHDVAIFRNNLHIGNMGDERGPIPSLTDEQLARATHWERARQTLALFRHAEQQAQQEGRRIQADPSWRSLRVFSSERIANRLDLTWKEE